MKNKIGILVLLIVFVLIGYTGSIVFGEEKYYEAQWDQDNNMMAVIATTRDPYDPIFPTQNSYSTAVTCDNGATGEAVWDKTLSKYVLSVSDFTGGGKCNVTFIKTVTTTTTAGGAIKPTVNPTGSLS